MSAIISECGKYRYLLTRPGARPVAFVMLNPSTADGEADDPTIRRLLGFVKAWGCEGIEVCNLYAYRATDPAEMLAQANPRGPRNDQHLTQLAQRHRTIVCAWGAGASQARARYVAMLLRQEGADLLCLGTTESGAPRHPLYLPAVTPLQLWSAP